MLRAIHLVVYWSLCCLSFVSVATGSAESDDPPTNVIAAAKTGLPVFLGSVPSESAALYGFSQNANLSAAELGAPILLRAITPTAMQVEAAPQSVAPLISDTETWFFPVLLDSQTKAMLVVARQEGKWQAVSLGYAPLAAEWNWVRKQWPVERGFHPQLLAAFQAKRFYVHVPEVDSQNLTQLISRSPHRADSVTNAPSKAASYSVLGTLRAEFGDLKAAMNSAQPKAGQ